MSEKDRQKKALARLAPALEALKDRDAAALRAARAAAEETRAEIAGIEAASAEAAAGVAPEDLASQAALQRFRKAARERIAALRQTLAGREATERAAMETLALSNGRLSGVERLRDAPAPKPQGR